MSAAVERLATLSRRVAAEPLQIEPLGHPVDVLAFVNDPVTAEILAALFGASGQGRVQFGGLNAAIQVLQSAPCPQLLVIDIAGLSDPITHLDRLADFCPEGTGVVLVGAARDEKLAAELRAVQPAVVVCLSATAAQSLLGSQFKLMRQRGQLVSSPLAERVVATIHPSAVLRAPDPEGRRIAYESLVADLKAVAKLLRR